MLAKNMTVKQYEKYCKTKYKKFFALLDYFTEHCNYYFNNKKELIIKHRELHYKKQCNNFTLIFNNCEMPNNTKIYNFDVEIKNYPKYRLPNDLHISRALYLKKGSNVKFFGVNTKVYEIFANGSELKNIKNLTILYNAYLRETDILELPDNLIIRKDLDISKTKIKKTPKNLLVYGDFDCSSSELKVFGKNNIIQGNLYAISSKLKEYPSDLKVNGSIDLAYTKITELPDNLVINGYLDISCSNIKKIGKNTIIKKYLEAYGSALEEYPKDLEVGGDITICSTNIKKLPDNLVINGNLNMYFSNIEEIGKNTTINGELIAFNCPLIEYPADLMVNGRRIDISNTKINSLPNILFSKEIECINISNTKINNLPLSLKNKKIKIEINNVIINNIKCFKNNNGPEFIMNVSDYEHFILKNNKINWFELCNKLKNKDSSKDLYNKNYIKFNTLLYISNNTQKKLILSQINKISACEIKKLIKENNKENQRLKLINYCRDERSMKFILENGYIFSRQELEGIEETSIKSLYEKYLIIYDNCFNKNTNDKKVELNKSIL